MKFGERAAAAGDWAVIGAYKETNYAAQEGGAAYVIRGQTQTRLVEPESVASDSAWFGLAVAMSAVPRVCIGAPSSDAGSMEVVFMYSGL